MTETSRKLSPSRRLRNAENTRGKILDKAKKRFQSEGYEQVGLRVIAADAGIDPALIHRYFGSKEGLYTEVVATSSEDPMEVLSGDREGFGERVAAAVFNPPRQSDTMGFIYLLSRSTASQVASRLVHEHIEQKFIRPFADWLGGEGANEKAWLVASILTGVTIMKDIKPDYGEQRERLAWLLQSVIDRNAIDSRKP